MEVLGCGVIHQEVMQNAHMGHKHGWAFGLGLERLAMVLFDIPDIRLFWSEDVRFTSQFQDGKINKFVPYSKYPMCYKDVSFWLPKVDEQAFHQNDVYEVSCVDFALFSSLILSFFACFPCTHLLSTHFHSKPNIIFKYLQLIRDIAGDIVEKVSLFDQFDNKKTGRTSHAYRIEYRYVMLHLMWYLLGSYAVCASETHCTFFLPDFETHMHIFLLCPSVYLPLFNMY